MRRLHLAQCCGDEIVCNSFLGRKVVWTHALVDAGATTAGPFALRCSLIANPACPPPELLAGPPPASSERKGCQPGKRRSPKRSIWATDLESPARTVKLQRGLCIEVFRTRGSTQLLTLWFLPERDD